MNRCVFSLLLVVVLLSACGPIKNYSYLQDAVPGTGYFVNYKPNLVVRKADRINIVVTSSIPELAMPFNQNNQNIQVGSDGQVKATSSGSQKSNRGYLVDDNGNIDFPILGLLNVDGLTLPQIKEMITSKLIEGNYIKDPIVTLEMLNFKFYALGALASKGEHSIEKSQVSILEAIALSGDLTSNARPDRVAVFRENDGSEIVYMLDLRSKDIFDSPAYYLKQNDVIYVEERLETKRKITSDNLRFITPIVSLVSTVISVILISRSL